MVLGIVPVLPGNTLVAQAASEEPSDFLFADKNQLMTSFYPEDDGMFREKSPLLLFGKDDNGNPIEWYILGKDNAIDGDNIMLFAETPMLPPGAKFYDYDGVTSLRDYTYPANIGYGDTAGTVQVYPNHWASSHLRQQLQDIAEDTDYFSTAEQGLLQETTVKTYDTHNQLFYDTTDKLYCAQMNSDNTYTLYDIDTTISSEDSNNTISIGTEDAIMINCSALSINAGTIWSRTADNTNSFMAPDRNASFNRSGMGGSVANSVLLSVHPATNINIESVLFASSVDYSVSATGNLSYEYNGKMRLRMDGNNKHIGTATYSDATGRILAKKDTDAAGTVTLVVQGRSNSQDWFYSKEITGTEYITKEMITTAVGYASGCTFTDCKIWLETSEDSLLYATMATEGTPINPVEVEIDAPVPGAPLDVQADTETENLVSQTPPVAWMKDGNTVTGNAEVYSTYEASVILAADDLKSLGFDPNVTATVNGNQATVTHNQDGTITVTYEFQTSGEQAVTYTAAGYSGTYDGQAHSIEVTVTDPTDAVITYSTDGTAYSANKPEYVNVGNYTVYYRIEKTAYTTIEGSKTIEITKKDMSVTAGNQTIKKGESIDATAYTVNGLVGDDAIDSVSLVPGTADVTDNGTIGIADDFSIKNVAGADVTANYNVTLVPGMLVIEEQVITHTASGYSGTYDGQAHSIEVTVTDPTDAVITYSTDGTAYSANKPEYVNVGNYTVYYRIEKTAYTTIEGSKTIEITKKDMSVTAGNQTIKKGESIDATAYTVNGLVGDDAIDSVSLVPGTADVTDNGTIDIADDFSIKNVAGADVTANYNVNLVPGKLVIEEVENIPAPPAEEEPAPAPPTVTESTPAPSAPVETPAPQAEVEETVVQNEPVSPKTGETAMAEVLLILVFGFGAILIEMVYRRRNSR